MVAFGDRHVTLGAAECSHYPARIAFHESEPILRMGLFLALSQTRSPTIPKTLESTEPSLVDSRDLADCMGLAFFLLSSC